MILHLQTVVNCFAMKGCKGQKLLVKKQAQFTTNIKANLIYCVDCHGYVNQKQTPIVCTEARVLSRPAGFAFHIRVAFSKFKCSVPLPSLRCCHHPDKLLFKKCNVMVSTIGLQYY